jgi:WD40 repeat protein
MKAIEKDRSRRYQSALKLGEDVKRFLSGDAVDACPPSWSYRAGKLARRHRTALAVATIILLSLSLATITSTYQAIRATRASREAIRNQSLADEQTRIASELLYAADMLAATRAFLAGDHRVVERTLNRHGASDRDYLRGFEWFLLRGLNPVETGILYRSNDRINDFIVLSDGKTVVTGNSSDQLVCIDKISGTKLAEIDAGIGWIYAVSHCTEGQILAAGDNGHVQKISWDSSRSAFTPEAHLQLTERGITSLAVAEAAQTVWFGDERGSIYELDLNAWSARDFAELPGNTEINDLEFSGGHLLAAQSNTLYSKPIQLHTGDEPGGTEWRVDLSSAMAEIRDVELSADGEWIVCGQLLGLVTVIKNGPSPKIEFTQLMPSDVHCVAISPDGDWIAAGDSAGFVHLIPTQIRMASAFLDNSASRQRRLQSWKAHEGKIEQIRFVTQNNKEKLELLSVGRDRKLIVSRPFKNSSTSFHPVEDDPTGNPTDILDSYSLWSKLSLREPATFSQFEEILRNRAKSPLSLRLASENSGDSLLALIDEQSVVMFSGSGDEDPRLIWQAPPGTGGVRLAVSSGARHFAMCVRQEEPRSYRIQVYEVGNAEPNYSIPSDLANDIVFSPSGEVLAYVWNNDIVLLKVNSGERIGPLSGHTIPCKV